MHVSVADTSKLDKCVKTVTGSMLYVEGISKDKWLALASFLSRQLVARTSDANLAPELDNVSSDADAGCHADDLRTCVELWNDVATRCRTILTGSSHAFHATHAAATARGKAIRPIARNTVVSDYSLS